MYMKECEERELWLLGLGDKPERGALVCSYLAEGGYRARTASLEELAKCKPLGILLDISPYSTDGWGILLNIKTNPETRDIPVLPFSREIGRYERLQRSRAVYRQVIGQVAPM